MSVGGLLAIAGAIISVFCAADDLISLFRRFVLRRDPPCPPPSDPPIPTEETRFANCQIWREEVVTIAENEVSIRRRQFIQSMESPSDLTMNWPLDLTGLENFGSGRTRRLGGWGGTE